MTHLSLLLSPLIFFFFVLSYFLNRARPSNREKKQIQEGGDEGGIFWRQKLIWPAVFLGRRPVCPVAAQTKLPLFDLRVVDLFTLKCRASAFVSRPNGQLRSITYKTNVILKI